MKNRTIDSDSNKYSSLLLSSKIRTVLFAMLCSFALIMAGCSDNSTGTNGGNGDGNGNGNGDGGDPEPTFTNVQQIFNGSCGGGSCHITTTTSGVRLDSYENVMNSEGSNYQELVVQPGDAAGSPLVDKIEQNPEIGARMPEDGNYLSDDEITLIRQWIDNGAEDN